MDRDYDLRLETPKGQSSGYLIFMIEGSALNGVLNIENAHASFFGGTFDEHEFSFKGTIYLHYLHFNYQVNGLWLTDKIAGTVTIKHKQYHFVGFPHRKTSAKLER